MQEKRNNRIVLVLGVEGKDWKLILEKKKNKRQKIHTHTHKQDKSKQKEEEKCCSGGVEDKIRWGQQEKWELRPGSTRLEICQEIYTTKFSGERILHTENA